MRDGAVAVMLRSRTVPFCPLKQRRSIVSNAGGHATAASGVSRLPAMDKRCLTPHSVRARACTALTAHPGFRPVNTSICACCISRRAHSLKQMQTLASRIQCSIVFTPHKLYLRHHDQRGALAAHIAQAFGQGKTSPRACLGQLQAHARGPCLRTGRIPCGRIAECPGRGRNDAGARRGKGAPRPRRGLRNARSARPPHRPAAPAIRIGLQHIFTHDPGQTAVPFAIMTVDPKAFRN